MAFLYRIAIGVYVFGIRLASLFSEKARLWVKGRKNWKRQLQQQTTALPRERIWVHCASLGEFEQGRPIIEALKQKKPEVAIILTFFSPSGYTIRKDYEYADLVTYLPADTPGNARFFMDTVQPQMALFVKYEFWYFFLKTLHQAKVPTYLVTAIFHDHHIFFQWYGVFFRDMLRLFNGIFVQNEASAKRLEKIGISPTAISGDTRIDRVFQLAQSAEAVPIVEQFQHGHQLFIAGSSWPPGEALLSELLETNWPKNWKMVIAPHDISERHIQQIQDRLTVPFQTYTDAQTNGLNPEAKVLIINNIGLLNRIYQYGELAYIGGGFGKDIHNTLEPLTFGLPVIIGPKYQKFDEAVKMVEEGGMFVIENYQDLANLFERLQDTTFRHKCSTIAKAFIQKNAGATQKTLETLLPPPN